MQLDIATYPKKWTKIEQKWDGPEIEDRISSHLEG